jgi:hypothetical protein|tara:strand:- start:8585 stop:9424 length:840 start_codon:yes stop_codon:yes gene_type:complete
MTWTTEKSGNAISEKKLKAVEKEDYSKKQKEWYENYQHLQTTKKERSHSRLVLGIWGDPKNGKTGLALDFPDDKIYVLDWDRGVESTWREHHDCTDRIEIHDPIKIGENNVVDIDKSEDESLRFVDMVKAKIAEGEKPIFVFDGVDAWYDACLLKVNPNPRKVTKMMPYQYGERNKVFFFLMKAIYNLNCDVIYITHAAEQYVDNTVVGFIPVWKNWGAILEQEIRCYNRKKGKELKYFAELMGSRTNGSLVGKVWTTREGVPPNIVWNGVPELRERNI